MAVQIPTLNELYTSIKGDLESEINISIPVFGKSYLNGLAAVQAAKLKLTYLAIASTQKNIFPDLAESEVVGGTLERFGRVKLNRSPFPATAAQYTVTVTGDIGATINANTTFKTDDSAQNAGKLFVLDTAFTFLATSETITLRALEGGLDSSLAIGNTLTATSPILNADELATVLIELVTPLSAELLEDYREKVLAAFREEPQGGAATDYRLWSSDAQGVKRVYPYAKVDFPNEVEVFVEATVLDSIDGKGTPSTAILTNVGEVIEFDPDTTRDLNERGRRPLACFNVDVKAVQVKAIDITITGFNGLTPLIETSIFNSVKNGIDGVRPFVAAADILENKNDILNDSKIIFFILESNPSVFNSLVFSIDGVPTISKTFLDGDIPYLNSISYV